MQQPLQGLKPMWPARNEPERSGGESPVEVKAAGTTATGTRATTPEELVEFFSDAVWRYASSQVMRAEDAEDIAMEVFAAAFSHFSRMAYVEDQRLWLLAVARKRVAGHLRKKYRRGELPLTDGHVAPSMETTDLQEAVRAGIQALPQPQADVLVLKYVNGLSTVEVSKVIRKSLPATNSLLQRARQAFREALGPAVADYAGV